MTAQKSLGKQKVIPITFKIEGTHADMLREIKSEFYKEHLFEASMQQVIKYIITKHYNEIIVRKDLLPLIQTND